MTKRDTPVLLITTAEDLYGRHGIDAVSLRQIAEAAGQRNPAVVQYHFSTKRGLLKAILEYRTIEPNRRRNEMLETLEAEGRLGDVRALLECVVYPLVELLREYTNFMRFVMQAPTNQPLADIMWTLDDAYGSGSRRLARHLVDAMDQLPLAIRVGRLRAGFQLLLQTVSAHATQLQDGGEGLLPGEVYYADMINAVTAFLLAEPP